MSLAILHCRAERGTEAPPVTIEVFLSGGLPAFTIVGMAETAVRESKDRVRGALLSSGFEFPQQRITISLGPADMKKTGGRYDLAIALGILAARRQFPKHALPELEFYGELALNGAVRPVRDCSKMSSWFMFCSPQPALASEVFSFMTSASSAR